MESSQRRRRQFWLGMLVSLISLGLLFIFIHPAEIIAALKDARYGYLGLTALGIFVFMIFRAIRWRFMLANTLSTGEVFHIQNIGYMLNMYLPLRAGDVARAVLIGSTPPVSLATGLSTMVVERVLDMLFIITLLPFTLAEVEHLPDIMQVAARSAGIIAITGILILIVAANQRPLARRVTMAVLNRISFINGPQWVQRLDELLAGLSSLTRLKDGLMLMVLSGIVWIPILYAYQAGLWAVRLNVSLSMASFTVCAAALSIAAPSSPGQIGVFHAGVTLALVEVLNQAEAAAASFAFIYHALNLLMMTILGLIGLARTGSTFRSVIQLTQKFVGRQRK